MKQKFWMKQKIALFLKTLLSNLAQNLLSKLAPSPNIFTESKVSTYCDTNFVFKNLNLQFSRHLLKKKLF